MSSINTHGCCNRNLNESIDYTANLAGPKEDDDPADAKGIKLFKISKRSEEFLNDCITHSVPNASRRTIRDKFGAPNTPKTACPTLDKVMKSRLSANTKSRDKTLAKQQALLLDAVGPLAHILEEATTGQLSIKGTMDAVPTAPWFLGNANMNINRERRKKRCQGPQSEPGGHGRGRRLVQGLCPSTPWRRLYQESQGTKWRAQVLVSDLKEV